MEHRHKDSALLYFSFAVSIMLTFIPGLFPECWKKYLEAGVVIVLFILSAYYWNKHQRIRFDDVLFVIMCFSIAIGIISFCFMSLKLFCSIAAF